MAMRQGSDMTGVEVGLDAMCASWFKEIGLQNESSQLAAILRQDCGRMVSFLRECAGRDLDVCTVVLAASTAQILPSPGETFARFGCLSRCLPFVITQVQNRALAADC